MKYLYHYILFITIVIIFAYINSTITNKETFTTYVRQMYRPYVRNARVFSEGFYETQKNSANNLFRKFGIM